MFSRRTQFVPKGEGVRVLLKRQNRSKFMKVAEPKKITFCHRQWKRKYILYQTFSKICKKSMFWANLRNVKGGKLLSEKDVVGPTHVYSFKSGAIFDQGGNKREIARLNGNKKQHILCKSRPEGVQKRFATCHHGWMILPGVGLPSLPSQGEFYKWQNFSTPAVRRFCQTQRRQPRQINARSVIICQTFAVIGFGCRFRCHS